MNTNTIIGALVAASIIFISSIVTLFTENPDLTFGQIKQATWVSLVGGMVLAFLKDYHAINSRRVINNITHSGDGGGLIAKCPPAIGLLAGLLVLAMLAGCAGTKAAYEAADGIEETAKVMGEHYYASVRELNNLDDQGAFSPSALARAQDIVRTTRPLVLELASAAQAYEAVRSAQTEVDLQLAINEAAIAISRLVDAVKSAGGGGAWLDEIESDIERVLSHQTLLAAA